MARTTNRLEGGVNSVVKDVLRNHRGLPEEHMRRACEWVCYMKTAHPRPESFIPDVFCFNVCSTGSAVFFRSVG